MRYFYLISGGKAGLSNHLCDGKLLKLATMIESSSKPTTMDANVFHLMESMDHEQVVFCRDEETGLRAIIAIHNTVLGPSAGGTRMWNYVSEAEALKDALRLSRGMTFKSSLAGLNIGGGKAVIIGDSGQIKTEALLRRFGKFINNLNGKYWTAEDVNMTTRDMEFIRQETPYVTGVSEYMGGGDPSPVTAYGVYVGMKAAAHQAYGNDSLKGKRILVQGVGHVGAHLVGHLIKEGAQVLISDIAQEKVAEVSRKHAVEVVSPETVFDADMDIYAPCALGATLNEESIPRLKCQVIAGGANNQLDVEDRHAAQLQARGVVYAPDFLINSGGIINVYFEMAGNYNREMVYAQTERIYEICRDTIIMAEKEGMTPHHAAVEMALRRIAAVGKVRLGY